MARKFELLTKVKRQERCREREPEVQDQIGKHVIMRKVVDVFPFVIGLAAPCTCFNEGDDALNCTGSSCLSPCVINLSTTQHSRGNYSRHQ
jgi:hypothetical protein